MTKLLKYVFVVGFVVLAPMAASAKSGTINGPYVGCITESALDEFIGAASNNDQRQMRALLNQLCFNLNGQSYSSIDVGFATSKIRVYTSAGSVVLYTITEALR